MIEHLDWDTKFFGIKVGRLTLTYADFLFPANLQDYDLVYIFTEPAHTAANKWALENGALLVDEKVLYLKEIGKSPEVPDKQIISYHRTDTAVDKQVVDIGIQSGLYSRFAVDPAISDEQFQELYRIWMNNSIDRTIASDVLTFMENDQPYGVLTLGAKNDHADIGILAVDTAVRGKQIGRRLIARAEAESHLNGFNYLQVVTQKANVRACRFYEANRFLINSINNIYHWWKK